MSIHMQQPQPYDLVGDRIQIAGIAGGAFEANFDYRLHEGHDEVTGYFMAGDGSGGHSQFQIIVDVSNAGFLLDRIFVEVFHTSPKDGAELDKVVVPIILGTKIVPDYHTYIEHTVAQGETLWSIATQYYGSGNLYHRLVAANPTTLTNPNVIRPGDIVKVPQA